MIGNVLRAALVGAMLTSAANARAQRYVADAQTRLLSRLHDLNQLEIQLGELASKKASSGEVRRLGERVLRNHRAADAWVRDTARAQGVPLLAPDQVEARQVLDQERNLRDKLRTLPRGDEFDRAFLTGQEQVSHRAIGIASNAEPKLKPGKVRAALEKVVSMLKTEHPARASS